MPCISMQGFLYICFMAAEKKAKKQIKPKKERASNYNEKLAVTGSFLDLMKAAAKHANTDKKEKPR